MVASEEEEQFNEGYLGNYHIQANAEDCHQEANVVSPNIGIRRGEKCADNTNETNTNRHPVHRMYLQVRTLFFPHPPLVT